MPHSLTATRNRGDRASRGPILMNCLDDPHGVCDWHRRRELDERVNMIGRSVDADRGSLELTHDAAYVTVERSAHVGCDRRRVAFRSENDVEPKIRERVGHRDSVLRDPAGALLSPLRGFVACRRTSRGSRPGLHSFAAPRLFLRFVYRNTTRPKRRLPTLMR